MKTIGIDIGTTTICGVLVEADTGKVLDSHTLSNDSGVTGDSVEKWERLQDPEAIFAKCKKILQGYLEECPDIVSIGVTGQMHGIVYVDKNGRSVSPLYTWQDKRGELKMEEHPDTSYAAYLSEQTGYSVATGYGAVTHFFNEKNNLVPEDAVSFCTIPDYIAMSLAGRKRPLVHQSMGASMGLYCVEESRFDTEAFKKAGMEPSVLPEITRKNTFIGKTAEGVPVSAALGDNQASFMGAVNQESRLLLNVGTGSQISVYSEELESGVECRPYLEDSWLLAGSPLCGGYAYSLVKRFAEELFELAGVVSETSVYELLNRAAGQTYESLREEDQSMPELVVDTRFNGTRKDTSIKGNIRNLTSDTFHPGNLSLGVLKGICEELYQFYLEFPEKLRENKVIVGSGNGIRMNPLLQKICCERFGMKMRIPRYSEEAAYGVALFSLLASGYYNHYDEVKRLIRYEE